MERVDLPIYTFPDFGPVFDFCTQMQNSTEGPSDITKDYMVNCYIADVIRSGLNRQHAWFKAYLTGGSQTHIWEQLSDTLCDVLCHLAGLGVQMRDNKPTTSHQNKEFKGKWKTAKALATHADVEVPLTLPFSLHWPLRSGFHSSTTALDVLCRSWMIQCIDNTIKDPRWADSNHRPWTKVQYFPMPRALHQRHGTR